MRDITLEDTFYIDFTTRAFATGIPGTLGGTPVLSVLEENNATPITAGVSVSVDRASVAGLNMATIVATAANGYENGKGYSLYISTGTVGGVSVVGEIVGEFTIGASAAAVDLANATDGLGALKTLIDTVNADLANATDGLGALKILIDTVNTDLSNGTDGLGALKTILDTLATTADLLDKVGAVSEAAAAGDPSATESVMQYVKQIVNLLAGAAGIGTMPASAAPANAVNLFEMVRAIYDDSNELQGDWVNGGRLDLLLDAIPTTAMRGTDNAALASVATEARLAELDAANIPADVDAIKADAASLDDTKIPDTLSLANINTQVDSAFTTSLADSVPADGTIPTREQAIYMLVQALTEFAISGTTLTVKKVDGSTTLMTYTLDDATNPTSRTRAT